MVCGMGMKGGMDAAKWTALYDDLPNRLLKVKIKDRSVVKTTNAERTCTAPAVRCANLVPSTTRFDLTAHLSSSPLISMQTLCFKSL